MLKLIFISLTLIFTASVQAQDLTKDLIKAIMIGDNAGIESALAKGVDVNAKTGKGVTPLMLACLQGNVSAVNALLDKGASVADQDAASGMTALMAAAKLGHLEIVKILISKGADKKVKSHNGQTAIELAKETGKSDVEAFLQNKK